MEKAHTSGTDRALVAAGIDGIAESVIFGWAETRRPTSGRVAVVISGKARLEGYLDRSDTVAGFGFHRFRVERGQYEPKDGDTLTVEIDGETAPNAPLVIGSPRGFGHFDGTSGMLCRGWAISLDDAAPELEICVDGSPASRFSPSLIRDDFRAKEISSRRIGFATPLPAAALDGAEHAITIRFLDARKSLPPGPTNFRFRPIGGVDRVTSTVVDGFAFNLAGPDEAIPLEVRVEGRVVGKGEASLPHDGIATTHGRRVGGFRIFLDALPDDLPSHDGVRTLDVVVAGTDCSVLDEPYQLAAERPRVASLVRSEGGASRPNRVIRQAFDELSPAERPRHHLDAVFRSTTGNVMVVGWVDDSDDPITHVTIESPDGLVYVDPAPIARTRRSDVEGALNKHGRHAFGFWTLASESSIGKARGPLRIRFVLRSGATFSLDANPHEHDDVDLRDIVLGYLADATYLGNPVVEAFATLDDGLGDAIVRLNLQVTRSIVRSPYAIRVGDGRKPKASIVVCLYGRAEYQFLQSALFSAGPGMEDYEFVYVSNSPELADTLVREAHRCRLIYGSNQTIVLLSGNAGFGAANNVAVNHCQSDRVLIVNPDVFPKTVDWAARHTALLSERPATETRLFGTPLYYDDGSLMHGGMFLEIDSGLSVGRAGVSERPLVRVEHYGKGAPPNQAQFVRSRPVPAVTGAFISIERAWFEALSGFSEDYVFGHYEDADLCLRSLERGTKTWLHDIRLWHLEGKGSTRRRVHEGGSIVNRWLFSRTWSERISRDLLGPNPPMFRDANAQTAGTNR